MKMGCKDSPKYARLKRRLGVPACTVTGVLEELWHFASRNAPAGDVGKWSNEDIAVALDWPGDPDELVRNLTESEWIEFHPEHRLIIHDWPDHCDEWVKKRLERMGVTHFADGTPVRRETSGRPPTADNGSRKLPESGEKLPGNAPTAAGNFPAKTSQGKTLQDSEEKGKDSPRVAARVCVGESGEDPGAGLGVETNTGETETSQEADPPKTKRKAKAKDPPLDWFRDWWTEFKRVYPKRGGGALNLAEAERKLKGLFAAKQADPEAVMAGAVRFRAWADATDRSGTDYIPMVTTWVHQRRWLEEYAIPFGAGARASPNGHGRTGQVSEEVAALVFEDGG